MWRRHVTTRLFSNNAAGDGNFTWIGVARIWSSSTGHNLERTWRDLSPASADGREVCTWHIVGRSPIGSGRPNIPHISSMTSVMATAVTAPDSYLMIGSLKKYTVVRQDEVVSPFDFENVSRQYLPRFRWHFTCDHCFLAVRDLDLLAYYARVCHFVDVVVDPWPIHRFSC